MGPGTAALTGLAPALERLLDILNQLGAPFLIGGSVASGSYGLPRQTNDIDIVADFRNVDMRSFCENLSDEFYCDVESVISSVSSGRPFNLIHLKGAFKFDFFPADADGFSQSELSRRRFIVSGMPGLENVRLPVCSAEDAILSKLVWFRQGGGVSDRQWHDILGILSVQSPRLDRMYLADWAERLDVADLLEAAFKSAAG
jgi:hypothetical protein